MTTDEFILKLRAQRRQIQKADFLFDCYSEAHGDKVDRIFLKGELTDFPGASKKRYKSEAYIKLRKKKGLQTSKVDVRFTTDMQFDHSTSLIRVGDVYTTGFKRMDLGKLEGLQKLYGDRFLWHTQEEIDALGKCASEKLRSIRG